MVIGHRKAEKDLRHSAVQVQFLNRSTNVLGRAKHAYSTDGLQLAD